MIDPQGLCMCVFLGARLSISAFQMQNNGKGHEEAREIKEQVVQMQDVRSNMEPANISTCEPHLFLRG